MNTQSLASQLRVAPTPQNEVAVLFSMGLANFEYDSEPTDRLYESNSHTTVVIYENTAHGVANANAHLFSFFLKFIEPQDIYGELREALSVPLLRDRTKPFNNIEEYSMYLEQLGYGMGHCGFIGEVFGHALTDNEERSTTTLATRDYMNEFTKECSYCALALDSLVGHKKQLNQLMINALRHPGKFPGFMLPDHIIDCIALGEPLINPEWMGRSMELPTGNWVPYFKVIDLID